MKEFANKYAFDKFSQNGEDGIITECLKRIGLTDGVSVEFGAADGFFCSNTANLYGWTRVLFDLDNKGNDAVMEVAITPENINKYVGDCDVLSIDIDGNDYAVWREYKGNPAIVVIEINSSFKPGVYVRSKEEGTSYTPMVELGMSKGYFLLCHTGNLIFIKNEYRHLFPEIIGDGLQNWDEYFKTDWV